MWTPVLNLKGDTAMEFAAAAIEAVMEISEDENASDIFKPRHFPKGVDKEKIIGEIMQRSISAMLRDHKDTMHRLFAANAGMTVEEYMKTATYRRVTDDISGMIVDKDFRDFFGFARTTPEPSTSAPSETKLKPSVPSSDMHNSSGKKRKKKKRSGNTRQNA